MNRANKMFGAISRGAKIKPVWTRHQNGDLSANIPARTGQELTVRIRNNGDFNYTVFIEKMPVTKLRFSDTDFVKHQALCTLQSILLDMASYLDKATVGEWILEAGQPADNKHRSREV